MKALGAQSIEHILCYLPCKYLDYRQIAPSISSCLNSDQRHYFKLKLLKRPGIERPGKGPARVKLSFSDGQSEVGAMVFGAAHLWAPKKAGDYVHISASLGQFNGWPQLQGVELVPIIEQGRIVARYRGKEKLVSSAEIAQNMPIILREYAEKAAVSLMSKMAMAESSILAQTGSSFSSFKELFYAIHLPQTPEQADNAHDTVRMINALYAYNATRNSDHFLVNEDSIIQYQVRDIKLQLDKLPFDLTGDQRRVIWEITKDLGAPKPMNRLVSGDVGCGKTLTYALPAVCAREAGARVGIIMPNTLLACQVADEIEQSFTGVRVQRMLGGGSKAPLEPANPIIVGTTAILWWLEKQKGRYQFDFLIIDEQQKLGLKQKEALIAEHTNVLEATATAIPRTAASILFGNMGVSLIEQCPVEKSIKTLIAGTDQRRGVFEALKGAISEGGQIAVLYPIRKHETGKYLITIGALKNTECDLAREIEQVADATGAQIEWGQTQDRAVSFTLRCRRNLQRKFIKAVDSISTLEIRSCEELEDPQEMERCKRSVESAARHWESIYPDRVVMIHGGLDERQKLQAIDRAKAGLCDVIVTSSVIEIGLTMPNLRAMLVVEANNYGASTLHQFRGRLARKGGDGTFIMSVDCPLDELSQDSRARLQLLVDHTRGSVIAEEDMRQRGFGDLGKKADKQKGFTEGLFIGVKITPDDIEELSSRLKPASTGLGI